MKQLLIIAALALPLLSACGEESDTHYIEVTGKARLEKPAELFKFEAKIEERDMDRLKSLAAASAKLNEVRDRLGRLKGLEILVITAGDMKVSTVRPKGCDPDYDEPKYPANCKPLDYIASIGFSVEGGPAPVAGNALSMATELNVETAGNLKFKVKDREAAREEVRQTALKKAMRTAKILAASAHAQISIPLEINYSEPSYDDDLDTITVTGALLHPPLNELPQVNVDLPSDTVDFEAQVRVKFALEKPKAEK